MNGWQSVLALDSARVPTAGSAAALRAAIGRGADLRIYLSSGTTSTSNRARRTVIWGHSSKERCQ